MTISSRHHCNGFQATFFCPLFVLPTFIVPVTFADNMAMMTIQVDILQTVGTLSVTTFGLHPLFIFERHETRLAFAIHFTNTFECFLGPYLNIVLHLHLFAHFSFHGCFFLFKLKQISMVAIFSKELSVTFGTCNCGGYSNQCN